MVVSIKYAAVKGDCMKTAIKLIGIIALVAVTGFSLAGCSGDNDDKGKDTTSETPTTPQPMSGKTAMEYFRDEGIKVGINLGNTFDAVRFWQEAGKQNPPIADETAWGNPPANQKLFDSYKNLGFNIIRIPVTWIGHIGPAPDYKVSETWLRRVAEVVGYANNAGLKALINIHHDDNHEDGWNGWLHINKALESTAKRNEITDKYVKVWTQIA